MHALPLVLNGAAEATEAASSSLDKVLDVAVKLVDFAGDMLNVVVANPILVIPIGASLVGVGVALIGALRHAWN